MGLYYTLGKVGLAGSLGRILIASLATSAHPATSHQQTSGAVCVVAAKGYL